MHESYLAGATAVSLVILGVIGIVAWHAGLAGAAPIKLGPSKVRKGAVQEVAVWQYQVSFWCAIVPGLVGLVLFAVAGATILFNWNVRNGTLVAELAVGFGGSTICGYFLRIWRECRETARKK